MSHLDQSRLDLMHRYWGAANPFTISQISLQDMREPQRLTLPGLKARGFFLHPVGLPSAHC